MRAFYLPCLRACHCLPMSECLNALSQAWLSTHKACCSQFTELGERESHSMPCYAESQILPEPPLMEGEVNKDRREIVRRGLCSAYKR